MSHDIAVWRSGEPLGKLATKTDLALSEGTVPDALEKTLGTAARHRERTCGESCR